jgi:hypothetical protein
VKRSSKQALTLTLVAFGITGGVGCGDDALTVPTSTMTRGEFVSQVEGICARGRRRSLRFEPSRDAQSERDALTAAINDTLLPSMQNVIDEIYALGAPRGEETRTEALLVALQKGVDEAKALDAPTLESVEDLLAPSGKLARKAGLQSCIYG